MAGSSFYTGSTEAQRYYYLTDHLGSVTVDEDGVVQGYDDYYPFGMIMPRRSSQSAESPRKCYTGHELEQDMDPSEKAVYYAGACYYDAVILL